MGQSTDAYLFYGFCWDDEEELFEDGDEWFDTLARKRGFVGEYVPYEITKEIQAEFDVSMDTHCHSEYRMPLVYVKGTMLQAWRGTPKAVPGGYLVNPSTWMGWDTKLRAFCDTLGITPPEGQEPQWWLVSYWG